MYLLICFHSEEDTTTLKISLYFLKQIYLNFERSKILTIPGIQLVLVTATKLFLNNGISEDQLIEIKKNVNDGLKDAMEKLTVKETKRSLFNVQYNKQRQPEIQVGAIVIVLFATNDIVKFCL